MQLHEDPQYDRFPTAAGGSSYPFTCRTAEMQLVQGTLHLSNGRDKLRSTNHFSPFASTPTIMYSTLHERLHGLNPQYFL